MPGLATLGCHHTCPAYDSDHAHSGGPVTSGSTTVFIGGKPACRVGDTLQCNSSNPDTVIRGSASIFIDGRPACRIGDPTQHGGVIAEGSASVWGG